jgi:hypothetical protein
MSSLDKIPNAFKIKTSHYIIASLSLVTALSWNEAMKQLIKKIYIAPDGVIMGNIIYALAITLVLIVVIHMLPDTKSELPTDTQAKIRQAEMIQNLQMDVNRLKSQNTHIRRL